MLGDQEIAVRAMFTRSHDSRLGVRYHTKASQKYVTGFAQQHRLATTMERVPPGRFESPDHLPAT